MYSKTRAGKKKQSPSLITSLPEEVIVDILARVPRCDYPTLSLVSKHFRSLVASPEIYARRSLLGCTELYLYVVCFSSETYDRRLYIIFRKANGNSRLVFIPSLPAMPRDGSIVAVGSKIYVFGGTDNCALSIDCRSHRLQPLPNMPVPISDTMAEIIDGRIYVIGHGRCYDDWKKVMVVFNTETQKWEEPVMIKPDIELGYTCYGCVVMAGKLYTMDSHNSFVYDPKENKWETDEMLDYNKGRNACVVDDILYYYDNWLDKKLRAYEPKHKCWRVVNGLEEWLAKTKQGSAWSEAVSCGGKLALFFPKSESAHEIWCAEISLERCKGGKIWGKVEWCDHVVFSENIYLRKSLAVII